MTDPKEQARYRLRSLLTLQDELVRRFGDTDYNVFIFGSYPTVRYVDGKSDIDIAIYTKDFQLYKQLALYLEDYFEEKHIDPDIFYIDTSMEAPLFCAPLKSAIQFTDYFPEELHEFEARCRAKLDEIKKNCAGETLTPGGHPSAKCAESEDSK